MPFLVGTDEAGYGPNLGPLVVAATVWHLPDAELDLYRALDGIVCRPPAASPRSLPIGDSKALFAGRKSLATLERGVLTMLATDAGLPDTLPALLDEVSAASNIPFRQEVTYCWEGVSVPRTCPPADIRKQARRVRQAMQHRRIRCLRVAADVIFPGEFNRGLVRFGNKAGLLTTVTCRLVRRLMNALDPHACDDVLVLCDRHGGRSRYAAMLQEEFGPSFVQVVHERRQSSCYRWRDGERQVEARFVVGGESHLPVALASMTAKYLRELSMEAWNRFWCQHLPSLRPTAGYPTDARRFKKQIAALQSRLQVEDHLIWRDR
jgi:ribonuclease HII